ncbi:MAG: hypothetical protein QOD77_654 [Thermoplasmata archaeon]|jgi:hypothetical protein|nr:hypothetical protein [Thermoplasmata archaeon]
MRWVLATAMLLFSLLAGCSSDDGGPDGTDTTGPGGGTGADTQTGSGTGTHATGGTGTGGTAGTGTGGTGAGNRTITFTAPVLQGSTPLNVTFSTAATGTDPKTQWRLSFGDGSQAKTGKGSVPASFTYVYSVGGNFTATFNVTYADGQKLGKALEVKAIAPPPPAAPDPLHFELGPSAGCAGDVIGPEKCISFGQGPDAEPIDGHWVPLDSRYWGVEFTSDSTANPDSDCVFVAEDQTSILGDASNGSGLCQGEVPELTSWLYIYPYAAGDPGLTVDFVWP